MQRYPEPPFWQRADFHARIPRANALPTSITYRYHKEPDCPDKTRTYRLCLHRNSTSYCSFALDVLCALACFKIGTSGAAFFQSVRKSFYRRRRVSRDSKDQKPRSRANAPSMRCCKSFRNRRLAPLNPAGVGNPGIPPARYCRYTSNLRSRSCWCKNRRTSCCAILQKTSRLDSAKGRFAHFCGRQ